MQYDTGAEYEKLELVVHTRNKNNLYGKKSVFFFLAMEKNDLGQGK